MAERTSGAPAPGKDSKGILNLRISKRSYIFNIKHPFDYVRQFKVEKRSEGIEQLKRFASTSFKGLMKSSPRVPTMRAIPTSRIFSKIILIVLALLLIFVVGIGAYFMFLLSSMPSLFAPAEAGGSSLMLSSDYSDLVSYGPSGDAVGLASVRLDSDNITDVNVSLLLYSQPVVRRVVLVDLGGVQDEFTAAFASNLSALLGADGGELETLQIDQLNRLPPSEAVYIILSEYVPASLLGKGAEPGRDLLELTKKGGVLIFAGYQFTDALSKTGVNPTIIKISPDYLRNTYGLSFGGGSEIPISTSLGLTLNTPLYSAGGGSGSFNIYGSVLVASFESWNSTGKLVLIPQTLKNGWNNSAADAAQSFFKIMRGVDWNEPIARGSAYLGQPEPYARFSLVTIHSAQLSDSAPYPYLLAVGHDKNNNTFLRSAVRPQISNSMVPQGQLSHTPLALPTSLSGQTLSMRGSNLATTLVNMELTAYYNNNPVSRVPIGTHSANLQYDYSIDLAPGDYVLVLSDTSGKAYAKSYLRVPVLSLVPQYYGWDSGTFIFALLQDGQALAPGTTVSGIKASMDDGPSVPLSTQNGKMVLQVPNAPVPAGTHTFKFDLGGTSTQTITETFTPPRNWWDETTYRLAMLAVLCIFLIGYVIRRPDIALYGLDVPDFPPLSKLAIPIKRDVVLGIFESVNKEYKWNHMPLKVSEIKFGFRKIM
ncbi:MAG: hypothetical protein Q7T16_06500, partial [Candidatus Burarchaeum sp.]